MRRVVLVVIASATLLLLSSTAGLTNDKALTLASHGDPFASCLVIGADSLGVNYPDTELEPWVAANPANRRNLIGSYQQDRWLDGAAKGLVAAYSFNSGQSWKQVPLPFSECAAPFYRGKVLHYERASDPWNSIGVDGIAYALSLSVSFSNGDNAVGAARSTDGGRTWTNQQAIIADSGSDPTQPFNDKESVTADPKIPGTAYAVWDRSFLAPCAAGARVPSSSSQRLQTQRSKERPAGTAGVNRAGTSAAAAAPVCFVEPTYFSKTTDGGLHWSAPKVIVPTAPDEATISNQIVVNHQSGALYNFFTFFDSQGGISVELVISLDGGTTWSSRQLVSSEDVVGVSDPRNPSLFVRSGIIVNPAIDPRSGQLYVAWEASFNGSPNDQAVISTSLSGLTGSWSPPSLISPPADPGAFTPQIDVNQLGQVGATFYDIRNLKPSTPASILPTDTWFRRTDGPGVSFGHEEHLGRFNMLMAPVAGGFFVGDYEGLVAQQDNSFLAFFSQSTCADVSCPASGNGIGAPTHAPDPQDVFATTIGGEGGQN